MMVAVFATMSLALTAGCAGRRSVAVAAAVAVAVACLGLAVWLFLWEIYSPATGFRMPWIQTHLDLSGSDAA